MIFYVVKESKVDNWIIEGRGAVSRILTRNKKPLFYHKKLNHIAKNLRQNLISLQLKWAKINIVNILT